MVAVAWGHLSLTSAMSRAGPDAAEGDQHAVRKGQSAKDGCPAFGWFVDGQRQQWP